MAKLLDVGPPPFLSGGGFNTLEQSGTIIQGRGAEIGVNNKLKQWSKRKIITTRLITPCIDIAKSKGADQRVKQYWQTYWCLNRATTVEGYLFGKYCKNRCCLVCQAIRKAVIINKYYPVLKEWDEAYFVTLTIRSVSKTSLTKFMSGMIKAFQKITSKFRKRSQRGTDWKFIGIRSLECNYNPERRTYNPHFHVIVKNEKMANALVDEWLQLWTPKWTSMKAQDIQLVMDMETKLIECIKYGAKIFTDPEVSTKKTKGRRTFKIYAAALDNITASVQGRRVFDRFGFNLPPNTTESKTATFYTIDFKNWSYNPAFADWFSEDMESGLSGYQLPMGLEVLLKEMDLVME